jgi:DNA-binding transcriptional MerR regulator
MEKIRQQLREWGAELERFRLPRWEELPDLELYMDQVITLIDRYLSPVIQGEKHPLLTSSMVNNYVKLGLIPAPTKKKYNRQHVAFLIAITSLKQVLTIPEIKEGILFQGKVFGIREAYDLFCEEQESAVKSVSFLAQEKAHTSTLNQTIPTEYVAVKTATLSFAMKLLAEKTIELEKIYLTELKEEQHE